MYDVLGSIITLTATIGGKIHCLSGLFHSCWFVVVGDAVIKCGVVIEAHVGHHLIHVVVANVKPHSISGYKSLVPKAPGEFQLPTLSSTSASCIHSTMATRP